MAAQLPVNPNAIEGVMCPIRSSTDAFLSQQPSQLAGQEPKIAVQIIPKRAPCMRDCVIFDAAKNQCMAKTVLEGLSKLTGGGGANLLGGLFGGRADREHQSRGICGDVQEQSPT